MDKNTKTYVLLGTVICIWGIIGYKVYMGYNGSSSTDGELPNQEKVTFTPKVMGKKDTFAIVADYRDPFLGTLPKKKKPTKTKVIKKEPAPEIQITYTGSIIDSNQKNSIFFIDIERNQVLIKPKQTIQGVTLVSGSERQIRIRHNGKLRTIHLQK